MPNHEIFTKRGSQNPKISEEEYLGSHLKGMDEMKKRWTMNAMKTWTKEDYDNYTTFHRWMLSIEEEKHETD
jgi:hypothetical protein